MKNLLLILSITMILTACGSKDKKEDVLPQRPGGDSPVAKEITPTKSVTELQEQASEELHRALKISKIDIKKVDKGEVVFIKCNIFETTAQFNFCKVGFNETEINIGDKHLDEEQSEELYDSIYDERVRRSLFKGRILSIKCTKSCILSEV